MRIEIERFGPIKKFSYDLEKDLIVTYGNNNIGKSYAMQIVYLLLKIFLKNLYAYSFPHSGKYRMALISYDISKMEETVRHFIASEEPEKDVTDIVVSEVYKNLGNMLLPEFINSCGNTFGNFDKMMDKTPVIKMKHKHFEFEIDLKMKMITGNMHAKTIRFKRTESDFHKSRNYGKYLDIYIVSDIQQPIAIMCEHIQKELSDCINSVQDMFEDVYFLPASRSGIYSGMNAFGSIVAELSKNRAYFTKKIEFPGISELISDYFISLSNIRPKMNVGLAEYFTQIENEILKGKVTFDRSKNALKYRPENADMDFEMTEVSSMVSEISPIVAFLKYIISTRQKGQRGKSVLFIEEPEAHLHPNNQIALIEIFAQLIRADVKLIISSHSNYIFNKLNNLVLGGKLDYHIYQPIVLLEEEEGSISKALQIDELGADDENFIDASERLYNEREEIIQKLNMEE